jgi:hypothetical protein
MGTIRKMLGLSLAWRVGAASAIIFSFVALPVRAQIRIQDVPLDFAIAAESKLQPFGQNEVATTTASFAVRNIQSSIDGALPGLNSSLACSAKNSTQITFRSIALHQTFTQDSPLAVYAEAHVRDCHAIPFYEGDVVVSIPIGVSHTSQAMTLRSDPPSVEASGLTLVGIIPAPNSILIQNAQQKITPKIGNLIKFINGQVKSGINSVKRWTAAYSVAIQSSGISYQNGDLIVSVQLSGQVPLAVANKWLSAL